MKRLNKILWGIIFLALGVFLALNACGVPIGNIYFNGWWTLFIIVPSFIGLFTQKEKLSNLIVLIVGVLLLLCAQNILSYSVFYKLIVPIILVIIGLKFIIKGIFKKNTNYEEQKFIDVKNSNNENAVFSGKNINFNNNEFDGANFTAVFGGIKCDLYNAIIKNDCVININTVFGGVDITMPKGVNVKINSNSFFGGVTNKYCNTEQENSFTITINAMCIFGGVEVK